MPHHRIGRPFAFILCIAAVAPACAQPDPRALATQQPAVSAPAAAALPSSAAPVVAPPALSPPPERACGATHVVAAGETLAGLATACYGARAYAGLLGRKNALSGSTLRLGQSLATPPLRDLAPCAPVGVCDPIYAAHTAFLAAQALTEHSRGAPTGALPHLEATTHFLEAALGAAEAKKIAGPKNQLKGALAEIASLRSGTCGEPGYCEDTFHQHLAYALEALGKAR